MLKDNWKKIGMYILFFIPLIAGTAGYLTSGVKLTDAIYAGIALYGFSSVSDNYNLLIEFARWTGPLVSATVVLCFIKKMWSRIWWRIQLFGKKDSVAVYSDEEVQIEFADKTGVIYPGEEFKNYAKSDIILFSSDQKSLQFYKKNEKELKGKKVYIGLKELHAELVDKMKDVYLFDISRAIARLLWKKIAVWDMNKDSRLDIVIYGSSRLAQEILATGLQLNLYSPDQKIQYYFITDNPLFQVRHQDMELMNGDKIDYHTTSDPQNWDKIKDADIVIVAEEVDLDLLQTIVVKAESQKIYYYSPKEGDAPEYISMKEMVPFGRKKEILTDGNIRQQKLIESAIDLNLKYAEKWNKDHKKEEVLDKQEKWKQLPAFLKSSNISSADFGEVIGKLSDTLSDEKLAKLEHIRWCRFYYLNYWKYGEPDNGDRKDPVKRIHKDLYPYDKIDPAEKQKNIDNVKMFRDAVKKNKSIL